jgi:hypothetical protein
VRKYFLFLIVAYLTIVMVACAKPAAGPAGAIGPQGDTGAQGISPTPVQLCKACVTHYPDTYAEVLFCYNGDLYGTYSANGGFSTEVVPGVYNSNGINCSCTVTIGSNCAVSP